MESGTATELDAQYRVLREKGTEPPFTGELWDDHRAGTFRCAGCGTTLFTLESNGSTGNGLPGISVNVEAA